MPEMKYVDFDLLLSSEGERRYTARVLGSPAGQATNAFTLPFSELELENFLLKIGRMRRSVRRVDSPEMEAVKGFGGNLFDAVFDGELRGCLRSSLDDAVQHGYGLRLRLRMTDAPALADLPWEYLYNPALNRFFSLSIETPIVRYIELPVRIQPLLVKPPLRVLVMISSPYNYPKLDVKHEWVKLNETAAELKRQGLVKIDKLEKATLKSLQQCLRRREYHIFHFIGHGGFDQKSQEGMLILEDEAERGREVSGQDLGTLLYDARTLRLALLNACEGARSSRKDPFAGAAQSLVQQGIPAVIAMQFEVTDEAAIALAQEFYASVADGYPVDAALAEARKALFAQGNVIEWGTPVLYMRSPDGRIFNIKRETSDKPQSSTWFDRVWRPDRTVSSPTQAEGKSPSHFPNERRRQKIRNFITTTAATIILLLAFAGVWHLFIKSRDASVSIFSEPLGATIFLRGDSIGVTPLKNFKMSAGMNALAFHKPGFFRFDAKIAIAASRDTTLSVQLQPAATLSLQVDPPEATVEIDAQIQEPERWARLTLPVGPHRIKISHPAYVTHEEIFSLISDANPAKNYALQKKSSAVTMPATFGGLQITSQPEGATVMLGNKTIGKTPYENNKTKVGLHQIVLRKSGYKNDTTIVVIKAQQVFAVQRMLARLAGTLRVFVQPEGALYLDLERRQGEENRFYQIDDLTAGSYQLKVVHPTLGIWEKQIDIAMNQTQEFRVDFTKKVKITVAVASEWGYIKIDGQDTGFDTPRQFELQVGKHTIEVYRSGYESETKIVNLLEEDHGRRLLFQLKKAPQ